MNARAPSLSRPWPEDERAWAIECFAAGDEVDEIAETSGRPPSDVEWLLSKLKRLSPNERRCLALRYEGYSQNEIGALMAGSHGAAWYWLSRCKAKGWPVPPSTADCKPKTPPAKRVGRPPTPPNPERNAAILQLLEQGLSYRRAGARFGASGAAVSGIVLRHRQAQKASSTQQLRAESQ